MPGPNDPWGGVQSDAGGGNTPGAGGYDANTIQPGGFTIPGGYNANATGLQSSWDKGHAWNVTDLWGGDNPYGSWQLGPASFAPQGDSAGFYDALAKQYGGQNAANAQQAYGNANTAWGQYMSNAQQQQGALDMMQGAAMGTAPSAAQMQMQQGIQQSTAAQQAMGNSARGGPGAWAAAQRGAMSNAAQMNQAGVGQSAMLRAQEMAQARGAYAQALGQYGAQALGAYGQAGQYGQNFQKQDQATMLGLLGYGQTAGALANQQENAWGNVVTGATAGNAANNANATAATAQVGAAALAAL